MRQKKPQKTKKGKQYHPLKRSSFSKQKKKEKECFDYPFFMKKTSSSESPIKLQVNSTANEDVIIAKENLGVVNQEDVNQKLVRSQNEFADNCEDDYIDDYEEDKCGIEKVQIFGTDGKHIIPILTDSEGRLIISADIICVPISYKEVVIKNITTANNFQFTQPFDISKNTITSFIIYNNSVVNSVTIQLQDSPDDVSYQLDLPEMIIGPKSFKIFTPTRFIRYQRIAYRSTNLNKPTVIDVFYQAQSYITS